MAGVPLCDLFNTNKLLLDNIEIKIKVDLNSNEFVLMSGEDANDCKIKIMSSTLGVRTVRVADSTKLEHVSIMQGRTGQKALPAIYTLKRTPTHARIIPSGVLNHTETDLVNGLIPQCIIFGMERNDAYNGSLARNPFNFQLFDLPYLLVYKLNLCISRPLIFQVKNQIFHHLWLKKLNSDQ